MWVFLLPTAGKQANGLPDSKWSPLPVDVCNALPASNKVDDTFSKKKTCRSAKGKPLQ